MSIPPVPQYWHFSSVVLTSHSSTTARFTDICTTLGISISFKMPWVWQLEFGPNIHYVNIECNFFQKGSDTVIDINLLKGDRWLYWDTIRKIRAVWSGKVATPRPMLAKYIQNKNQSFL